MTTTPSATPVARGVADVLWCLHGVSDVQGMAWVAVFQEGTLSRIIDFLFSLEGNRGGGSSSDTFADGFGGYREFVLEWVWW